jgi:hypothetical protein
VRPDILAAFVDLPRRQLAGNGGIINGVTDWEPPPVCPDDRWSFTCDFDELATEIDIAAQRCYPCGISTLNVDLLNCDFQLICDDCESDGGGGDDDDDDDGDFQSIISF